MSAPTVAESLDRLAAALGGLGLRVRVNGNQLYAQCPAHDDGTESLSAKWVAAEPPYAAGRVLVNCFAGCAVADIAAAAGLTLADLFDGKSEAGRPSPASVPRPRQLAPRRGSAAHIPTRPVGKTRAAAPPAHEHRFDYRRPESRHAYTDAAGTIVGRVDRVRCTDPECPDLAAKGKPGKTFVSRAPDGRKGKPAALGATLYRLPDVIAAAAARRPVWLCEGEGDADAVAAAGECGTSAYGGAGRDWHPGYTRRLMGADVLIVADRDPAGYRRAAAVVAALGQVPDRVRVVAAAIDRPGADISDHLAAGLTLDDVVPIGLDELDRLAAAEPAPTPAPEPETAPAEPSAPDDSSPASGAEPEPERRPYPKHHLPTTGRESFHYSTGDDGDGLPRGVYMSGRLADELPYVFARIIHRDGAGRRSRMSYRLGTRLDAGPDELTLASHMAVKTGEWAEPLGVPLSADDKVIRAVASAIYREAERSAPLIEAAPRWTPDGALEMPPDDCGPPGYGALAGDEPTARQTWAELGELLASHPKVALIAGAALGSPFVAELKRQSYLVHSAGRDRRGKTTAHVVAAALFGDPEIIVRPWDVSAIGLTQLAGEYGCLPPILDELGARRGPKAELQNIVFQFAQGARRTKGGRDGRSVVGAPWRGVVLSTGNVSLLANLTERGAIARVIELATPIVGTDDEIDDPAAAADAERLEALAAESYGWPFAWVRRAGITPARFGALVAAAESDLGMPGGGTLRTLARHVAAAVAGAGVLGQVIGNAEVRAAALAAASDYLAEMADRLDELAAPPADRLASAVTHALISRPDAYPPLADLRDPENGVRRFRDVEGFRITAAPEMAADPRPWAPPPGLAAGDIAVLHDVLPKIAADGGLDDALTALRGLRDSGRLLVTDERDGRLRRRVRIRGLMADVYVFRVADPSADDDAAELPGTPGTDELETARPAETLDLADPGGASDNAPTRASVRVPISDRPGTPGTDQLATARPAETRPIAVPGGPGTDQLAGNSARPAQTSERSSKTAGKTAGGGAVPGNSAAGNSYGLGAVYLVTAGTGYTGNGDELAAPDDLADVIELAAGVGLGAPRLHKSGRDFEPHVYLDAAGCGRYGIPAEPPDTRTLALPADHPAAAALRAAGWEVGPIRPSTRVWRRGGPSVVLTLIPWLADAGPGLDALTADDPSPASLARRLGTLAGTVIPVSWTAAVTAERLMTDLRPAERRRRDAQTGNVTRTPITGSLTAPVAPSPYDAHPNHPAARGRADTDECREESLIWTRPRELWAPDELAAAYVVSIDVNTQFLAAAASLPVGLSAPRPMTGDELAALNGRLADVAAISDPAARMTAARKSVGPGAYMTAVAGLDLDPRLPSPLTDTGLAPERPIPLHAPTIRYALELGGRVTVSAGWVSDDVGPYLDPWNRRLAAAYLAALAAAGITPEMTPAEYLAAWPELAERDPDAAAVVKVIKALAKGGIGRLRQDPDVADGERSPADRATWRPDIRAEVIARARTDLHRKVMRTFNLAGVAPVAVSHDAIAYASDDPSPASVVPVSIDGQSIAGAFRIGPRPGWVKHSHTLTMADALGQLDAGLNPAVRYSAPAGDE